MPALPAGSEPGAPAARVPSRLCCLLCGRAARLAGSVAGGLVASRWGYPAALGAGAAATAAGLVVCATVVVRRARKAA